MILLDNKTPETIGLIGHTIINYPTPEAAEKIVDILVKNNADLIELQIPFSEPIADGPVFAKANHEALNNGVKLADCYDFMGKMTSQYAIPFVFMTYANIVLKQGFKRFIENAKAVGARGAIIPDLPLDMAFDYLKLCHQHEFAAIPVVAPNISDERLMTISPFFDGFIYAVARAGVTGTKTKLDNSIIDYINRLRNISNLPIAIGFGIASGKDVDFLRPYADYAVIGTQTLRAYQADGLEGVKRFWQELSQKE